MGRKRNEIREIINFNGKEIIRCYEGYFEFVNEEMTLNFPLNNRIFNKFNKYDDIEFTNSTLEEAIKMIDNIVAFESALNPKEIINKKQRVSVIKDMKRMSIYNNYAKIKNNYEYYVNVRYRKKPDVIYISCTRKYKKLDSFQVEILKAILEETA